MNTNAQSELSVEEIIKEVKRDAVSKEEISIDHI